MEPPDSPWKTRKPNQNKKSKLALPSGSKLKAFAESIETNAVSTVAAVFKTKLRVAQQYIERQ